MTRRAPLLMLATVGLLAGVACVDLFGGSSVPLVFDRSELDLGVARDTALQLTNDDGQAYGPLELSTSDIVTAAGSAVFGPLVTVAPATISTLNPGQSARVSLAIDVPVGTADGTYEFTLRVRQPEMGEIVSVRVAFLVNENEETARVATLTLTAPSTVRQGDATPLAVTAADASGAVVPNARYAYAVSPAGAGYVDAEGRFVGYQTGSVSVTVSAGSASQTATVNVAARNLAGSFQIVGHGPIGERFTSDLWALGNVVFTGTWSVRTTSAGSFAGNTLYAWNVSDPSAPALTDSVSVDARVVNDVKIRDDGTLAVMTHEGSADGLNGVTLLDLSDPQHPTPITRFSNTLQTGVHNAWLDGNYLYLVVDGIASTSGLRVLDVSDPQNPSEVASFYAGSSFLHDVYVRDGLAFLSHWDAGLVILDVGNGIAGGSPTAPVEVSRLALPSGQTHNAWYWPETAYVFVGEEDFGTPGIMHVIDASDLLRPREVATFRVPGTTPHNFWLDETAGILYLAWYSNGVRALDVTGTLIGELDLQGREYGGFLYAGAGSGCAGQTATTTCNWAPQLDQGLLYVSDMNTGLWVLQPSFP